MESAINRVLSSLGYEVHRRRESWTMGCALESIARATSVRSVIDIGAAKGDWTRLALNHFPGRSFLMLEPLVENQVSLQAVCSSFQDVHYELAAAGNCAGTVPFDVTDDLDGSGIYGYAAKGRTKRRVVPQITLDEAVVRHGIQGPFLLKFDTHGYEMPIFEGARQVLQQTHAILMECYFFPVSPTARVIWEICEEMRVHGFRVADLADPMRRPKDGMLWQVDLVFLRADHDRFADDSYQ